MAAKAVMYSKWEMKIRQWVLPTMVSLLLGGVFFGMTGCGCGCGGEQSIPPVSANQLAFDSDRTGNYEIYLMNADGSGVRALTNDHTKDSWWPRISPDRSHLLFYQTPAGTHDGDYTKTSLWMKNLTDGSPNSQIIANGANGWQFQGHAEWAPDGNKLVMFAGTASNLQIFTTDAAGKNPVAITNRPSPNIDPSWSPDGATLAFVGSPKGTTNPTDYEVYTVPSTGGTATRLTNDGLIDNDPYFSPDGRSLAFLTQTLPPGSPGKPLGTWGIRKLNLAAAGPMGIPGIVIDDGQVNSKPDWSLDGSLIRFHRTLYFGNGKFSIFSIHPDGSGLSELTPGQSTNSEFPSAGAIRR